MAFLLNGRVLSAAVVVAILATFQCKAFTTGRLHSKLLAPSVRPTARTPFPAFFAEKDDDDDRLRSLGYSDSEIQRSRGSGDTEPEKVRVDLVDNVDSVSLTAVGFALVAFNFFVLANMGDGGIAGFVATIMNNLRN